MKSTQCAPLLHGMSREPAADGNPARVFRLRNHHGMQVLIMDVGATWLSCELPLADGNREVLLGSANMRDHRQQTAYFGATVGRYANRIQRGQFSLGDTHYQLNLNQGENTLHGGIDGFDKRRWRVIEHDDQGIVLSLTSADGDQGFPGNLKVQVHYQLSDDNALTIDYHAVTDKACPVNLTNHAYFNLDGCATEHSIVGLARDGLGQQLQINAEQYVPVDAQGIPCGEFAAVAASGFDFRQLKNIGRDLLKDPQQQVVSGYDHAYILNRHCGDMQQPAAVLLAADKRVQMTLSTTKPALQLYSGNFLAGLANRVGGYYQNYAGVALETQFVADAPNHRHWPQPDPILQPGVAYQQQSRYHFSW